MNEPSAVLLFDDELHIVSVLPLGRSSEESEQLREIIDGMMAGKCRCKEGGECSKSPTS